MDIDPSGYGWDEFLAIKDIVSDEFVASGDQVRLEAGIYFFKEQAYGDQLTNAIRVLTDFYSQYNSKRIETSNVLNQM